MTKEDWKRVEKALAGVYGFAKLMVDGKLITFERRQVSMNQLGIIVYVDGICKADWIGKSKEYPEQRFLRKIDSFLWTPKRRAELKKWPKRMLRKYNYDPDAKYHYFSMIWRNVTEIRRHYEKTFSSIELIEVFG